MPNTSNHISKGAAPLVLFVLLLLVVVDLGLAQCPAFVTQTSTNAGMQVVRRVFLTNAAGSGCVVQNVLTAPTSMAMANNVTLCRYQLTTTGNPDTHRLVASRPTAATGPGSCEVFCTACGVLRIDNSHGLPVELLDFSIEDPEAEPADPSRDAAPS